MFLCYIKPLHFCYDAKQKRWTNVEQHLGLPQIAYKVNGVNLADSKL